MLQKIKTNSTNIKLNISVCNVQCIMYKKYFNQIKGASIRKHEKPSIFSDIIAKEIIFKAVFTRNQSFLFILYGKPGVYIEFIANKIFTR